MTLDEAAHEMQGLIGNCRPVMDLYSIKGLWKKPD